MEIDTKTENNIAFIDGQNLFLGTREDNWSIDHTKFRVYLKEKYSVVEAYYFLGFQAESQVELYRNLERAGFVLVFKEHVLTQHGRKKGNVDSEIIFNLMKKMLDNEPFDKAYIVSGDGDYKKLVDYLIVKERFGKILFPNQRFASSLYMYLGSEFFDYLGNIDEQNKIKYIK